MSLLYSLQGIYSYVCYILIDQSICRRSPVTHTHKYTHVKRCVRAPPQAAWAGPLWPAARLVGRRREGGLLNSLWVYGRVALIYGIKLDRSGCVAELKCVFSFCAFIREIRGQGKHQNRYRYRYRLSLSMLSTWNPIRKKSRQWAKNTTTMTAIKSNLIIACSAIEIVWNVSRKHESRVAPPTKATTQRERERPRERDSCRNRSGQCVALSRKRRQDPERDLCQQQKYVYAYLNDIDLWLLLWNT